MSRYITVQFHPSLSNSSFLLCTCPILFDPLLVLGAMVTLIENPMLEVEPTGWHGNKNLNGSRDHDHAPFRDDLSSVCWDIGNIAIQ